jgi:hypothetical protein
LDVDEWLGKIEVTDLPDLVEVITEVMGGTTGEKKKAKKANR